MTPSNWKILKSKTILKDDWISLRAESCELPGGRIIEPYYILDYPTWVNVVAITNENQVLLVKQYRHGIKKTVLELPCGCVETKDKNPEEAIRRELLEETGYLFKSYEQIGVLSPNSSNHSNLTFCFLATDEISVNKQKLDPSEQIDVVLVPFAEFLLMAKNGVFNQALHVAAIFYLLCKLKRI